MSLAVTHTTRDDAYVVLVAGEVDVSNASELRSALDEALATDATRIEVNLAEVPYVDSTGIGVLVGASRRATDASKQFGVTNPQRNVQRVLTLLGVGDELGVGL